jgi:hypothetical protein
MYDKLINLFQNPHFIINLKNLYCVTTSDGFKIGFFKSAHFIYSNIDGNKKIKLDVIKSKDESKPFEVDYDNELHKLCGDILIEIRKLESKQFYTEFKNNKNNYESMTKGITEIINPLFVKNGLK